MGRRPDKSANEVLRELQQLIKAHGDVTQREYRNLPDEKPSMSMIYRRFGSFDKAKHLAQAGITEDISDEEQSVVTEYTETGGVVTTKSRRIKTLDDALEYAQVDLEQYEVDRYVINKWEVGAKDDAGGLQVEPLYQVKVWLKPRVEDDIDVLRDEMESFIEIVKAHAPKYPNVTRPRQHGIKYLYEITIFDLHLAKLCWAPEVGEDYDIDIAERLYHDAINDLVTRIKGLPIELIALPTGNDFLHVDNLINTTTHGTRQDVDSRWPKAFTRAHQMLVATIDKLAAVAPVHVPMIPGNHDWERAYYLGDVLKAWYRHSDCVTIDNDPDPRKYILYGNNLIGYTHGKNEKMDKLPLIMANQRKEDWAATEHHEWHIGHWHKKGETKYNAGDTFGGVIVRTIPSLSAADAWHHETGWINTYRAAEAYLWEHGTGYAGHYSSNVIDNRIAAG